MPADLRALLLAHPDLVQQLLDAEVDAAKADPRFLPDLLTAATTGSYAGFVLHHLRFVLTVGGVLETHPDLLTAVKGLLV